MDDIGDNAPHLEISFGRDFDEGIGRVFWDEVKGVAFDFNTLDGELVIEDGYDDLSTLGSEGSVDNEDVSVMDAPFFHRVSFDADEEGGGGMGNEKLICSSVHTFHYQLHRQVRMLPFIPNNPI